MLAIPLLQSAESKHKMSRQDPWMGRVETRIGRRWQEVLRRFAGLCVENVSSGHFPGWLEGECIVLEEKQIGDRVYLYTKSILNGSAFFRPF